MRALQLIGPNKMEVREVPVPEPGPGEVLVKVGGAGLCHSDLHLLHAGVTPPEPFTLGHETAGWVEATGPGVRGLEADQPVIVHGAWGCGTCEPCAAGVEQHCRATAATGQSGSGLFRDGGLAEYLLVPAARHLVPLGDLDPRTAAPLDDAALTPYRVIKGSLPLLTPGSAAVVIGIGGLGHAAVQLLREVTATRIVAVDTAEDKLALAAELGAHATVRAGTDGTAAEVVAAAGGWGAAVVLDCVGTDATIALGARVVRPMGSVVVIGVGGGTFPFSFSGVPYGVTMATTFWGTHAELREVLALAAAGRLEIRSQQIALEEAPAAYERMERGELATGRSIALPNG